MLLNKGDDIYNRRIDFWAWFQSQQITVGQVAKTVIFRRSDGKKVRQKVPNHS